METFLISDTHFSHANILTFADNNKVPLRPEFNNIEEMDELMIENWNKTVSDKDKVYHLGDVTMHKRYLNIVARLKGKKRLILGNHDIFDYKLYAKLFDGVYAMRVLPKLGLMLTHVPIHKSSIKKGWINVHGHTHKHIVDVYGTLNSSTDAKADKFYLNVSVERHNYTPVHVDIALRQVNIVRELY